MFKDIGNCEEFLSHIDADQLGKLLKRDDLNAALKHNKEERTAVAAKLIGAVRLVLVDRDRRCDKRTE